MDAVTATLLSRACTTGWLDWVWGELWLLPDGAIRVSSGWSDTLSLSEATARLGIRLGPTVPLGPLATKTITQEEIQQLANADARNRWIRWADVRRARLRQGILTSRLHAELIDGSTVKLLWMKRDPGFEQLRRVLGQSLGANLELR
jgi:hypothetical protein